MYRHMTLDVPLRSPPPAQLSLHFFPGEPLLMSSGADNSIKHWLFDAADGTARLLRFRGGHAAPPTLVRHYGQVRGGAPGEEGGGAL